MNYMMRQSKREQYANRMRQVRPFQFFGIHPEWYPDEQDIDGFIHDEVVRQFHDTRVREDGGVRIQWMRAAWDFARHNAAVFPDVEDILKLGALVEPKHNSPSHFRTVDVMIAGHSGCSPAMIPKLVPLLVAQAPNVRPVQGLGKLGKFNWRANWEFSTSQPHILTTFAQKVQELETADDWYLCYEMIHPFADGNGRTGKILHNWLLGTLEDPVLVEDYFGGGNP